MDGYIITLILLIILFLFMMIYTFKSGAKEISALLLVCVIIFLMITIEYYKQDIKLNSIIPMITSQEGIVIEKIRTNTYNSNTHKLKITTSTETFELDVYPKLYKTVNNNDKVKITVSQKIDINGEIIEEKIQINNEDI